ncbi:MAG TPA: wax ester/triacylglycerol synthase family O-acyltransferase [Solirubrobacteraceae bacterium]|nr:wax ester/triacylglycerol synthase family O-acyltransferase [Solirubrobacteraceae bacterium]
MDRPVRLSSLDTALLYHESSGPSHMHVASVMTFRGRAPAYSALVEHVERRLHLVPRYRQRLAFVPLGQGRPVWIDDTHFNPYYHIRQVALPAPAGESKLKALAGEIFSQRLARHRPLWELWLVEHLAGGRFALIAKAHHALVDGLDGVDLTTVLLDRSAASAAAENGRPPRWDARPEPRPVKLLTDALLERVSTPSELARSANALLRRPRRLLRAARESLAESGALAFAGLASPAPPSPFNVDIGPHRRYTFLDVQLALLQGVKDRLGGTINDAVLAAIAHALGRYLRAHGHETEGLELRAMVPVSVRVGAGDARAVGELGAMWVPLPVGLEDIRAVHALIARATRAESSRTHAVRARALTGLPGFAPPTILSQAARLQVRQQYFNLVVTNVPGPQLPLYLLGRRLEAVYPVLPLAGRQALGISLMSYNGRLHFGLLGDYDALPDLEQIAKLLEDAISELARAAAAQRGVRRPRQAAAAGGRSASSARARRPAARDRAGAT